MTIKHAFIVPLIGGQALGQVAAFGTRPDYILSYGAFKNNDEHLLNHYKGEVPYYLLDEGQRHPHTVDVIGTTCPCAGLSQLSGHASSVAPVNDWMYKTATYVMEEVQPKVFWGENAPGFAGKVGRPVVDRLAGIGKKNGYTMSIYRTRSLLHGVGQVRERSFYFFWKDSKVPLLNYFDKPITMIEDTIRSVDPKATQQDAINTDTPSQDPVYKFILEEMHKGISHSEFSKMIDNEANAMEYIENAGIKYNQVSKWATSNGLTKFAEKCTRVYEKLESGGNVMRHVTKVPKHHIGAFVGSYPTKLTHPDLDRYITLREGMTIMGLPQDFEMINAKRQYNHMCQNVPVGTATDIANEIKDVLDGKRDKIKADLVYQYNANKRYQIDDTSSSSLQEFI